MHPALWVNQSRFNRGYCRFFVQLEALQEQLVAAEQARMALQQEVEQLRALGVQQVRLRCGGLRCGASWPVTTPAPCRLLRSRGAELHSFPICILQELALTAAATPRDVSPLPSGQASSMQPVTEQQPLFQHCRPCPCNVLSMCCQSAVHATCPRGKPC